MARPQRKLTAVMFTDIVGYSAMVNDDELRARQLLEMHWRLMRRHVGQWQGRLIDRMGDGSLTIFDSALHAVECAVSIQQAMQRYNASVAPERQLRIRIGLHQGDVEHGQGGVYGDGVNVCARLEPLSPPGGIAASSMVCAQIHGPLRGHFQSWGEQNLKNIPEPLEVLKLAEADVPAAAELLGPQPRKTWSGRTAATLAAGALLLAAAAVVAWQYLHRETAADDASIAVLPLENLATEPGSAELVAGLHDSLITEIARAPHLKVISRSSVMRYAQQRASVPEVAALLKVANVLEGSVQRQGARVRVNVQLIRAATDEHIWAEIYDRNIEDLFELQIEIAREIARKIHGNLALPAMPESERPTRSSEAYELYLRAISREEDDPKLGFTPPDAPLRLLEQAVALDPLFALAHAAIARYAAWGARWAIYTDPSRVDQYVARAVEAAQQAIRQKPEMPEALLAMGLASYWKDRDPALAEPYFTRALQQRPAYPAALYMLSGLYANTGNLDRAVDVVRALLDVDPANEKAYEQLMALLERERRYDEADQLFQRWLPMSQNREYAEYLRAQLQFYSTGNLAPWKRLIEQAAVSKSKIADVEVDRWILAMYEARFGDAAALAEPQAADFMQKRNGEYGWAIYAGQSLALGGKPAKARPYLEAVAAYVQAELARRPDDHNLLDLLGQTEGLLGQQQAALKNINRALDLAAPAAGQRPAATYYEFLTHRAQLLAMSGQREPALADLDRLLREPSGRHAHEVLRDPLWGPLLRDPEFQARVKSFLPRPQ